MGREAPVGRVPSSTRVFALPGLEARLLRDPPARVADVACAGGDIALSLARSYPSVLVDGWDADDASIAGARRGALEANVDDRVRFEVYDGTATWPQMRYDVVVALRAFDGPIDARAMLDAIQAISAADAYVLVPAISQTLEGAAEAGFEHAGSIGASFEARPVALLRPAVNRLTATDR